VLRGQVTDDLVATHEELRDYINGLGATVFPQTPYPQWGPAFREFFKEQLAQPQLLMDSYTAEERLLRLRETAAYRRITSPQNIQTI
jgi:hypothetical protein